MRSIIGTFKFKPGRKMRLNFPKIVVTEIVPCFTVTNELNNTIKPKIKRVIRYDINFYLICLKVSISKLLAKVKIAMTIKLHKWLIFAVICLFSLHINAQDDNFDADTLLPHETEL